MKIALIVVGVLVVLVLVVAGVGYALPVKHRAARAITLHAAADTIFAVLTNVTAFPEWRSRVKQVEMVARPDGLQSYRETGNDGAILYVVDESTPGKRLVTRIADDKLPFGGKWTYELAPKGISQGDVSQSVDAPRVNAESGSTTEVRITEDGEVYNPIFRFVSRFVFGHHATIETYLNDLARKFGETATIFP